MSSRPSAGADPSLAAAAAAAAAAESAGATGGGATGGGAAEENASSSFDALISLEPVTSQGSTPKSALTTAFTCLRQSSRDLAAEAAAVAGAPCAWPAHAHARTQSMHAAAPLRMALDDAVSTKLAAGHAQRACHLRPRPTPAPPADALAAALAAEQEAALASLNLPPPQQADEQSSSPAAAPAQ